MWCRLKLCAVTGPLPMSCCCWSGPRVSASVCFLMTGRKDPPRLPCFSCPLYLGASLSFSGLGPDTLLISYSREGLDPLSWASAAGEMAPNHGATNFLSHGAACSLLWRPQPGSDLSQADVCPSRAQARTEQKLQMPALALSV